MKQLIFILAVATFAACKSGDKTKAGENTTTTEASPASASVAETSPVSFKVNDTLVNTKKSGKSNDSDEQLGLYTEIGKNMIFTLMGDVPSRPHRGTLEFNIHDFKFAPGEYKVSSDNQSSFRRYQTENAGLPTEYVASSFAKDKGSEFTINFTKVVRDEKSMSGRDWLASGTFSAKMLIKEDNPMKRTSDESIRISEGTFENVRIAGGPKAE